MKNKFLILAALILVATTTSIIVSCNKETQQEESATNDINSTNSTPNNMDDYLLAFKQKMLSAQKGDETIYLEQACRELGNLLNYDFGDANYATDVFVHDTLYVKLELLNGMVDLSKLALTYNDAFNQILTSYRALNLPEKSVYSIYCEPNDGVNRENNNEELMVVVNYRGLTENISLPSLHDTLSWHPKRIGTSCDDPSINHGGAITMQQWLEQAQPELCCPDGGRVYFTNQVDWVKKGYETFDLTDGRYKIFTEFTYQIDTVCIPHEDMEYYFTNILDYMNQEKPSNYVVEWIYVDIQRIPYSQPNINNYPGDCWYWRIVVRFAKMNCTGSGAVE